MSDQVIGASTGGAATTHPGTAATAVPAPVEAKERLATLDVIRGVAVCGILLMNIIAFGLPFQAYLDPSVYGGHEGPNLWAWILNEIFIEGTQRGLFTLLFGAGVILFTEKLEASQRPHAADAYFRRYLWLIGFGLVHGFVLLWVGDILFVYGVLALFIYAFRRASPKTLILIALAGLAFNTSWNQLDLYNAMKIEKGSQAAVAAQQAGATLTAEQQEAIAAWDRFVEEAKPSAAQMQKVIDASRGSYFTQLVAQAPFRSYEQNRMIYRSFFDFFSMMLIGMALFKTGLLRTGQPLGIYWRMLLIGYAVGLTVNYIEVSSKIAAGFSVSSMLRSMVTYDLGRLAMTVGHVGLLMLWCNSRFLAGLKRRLAAVGQMAFTNYVVHSIICAFVFFGVGFGLFGQLQRYQLYYVVAAIWLFQLIVSPIWLAHYRYGPLEWLWRTLTYGKSQSMRRTVGAAVPAEST